MLPRVCWMPVLCRSLAGLHLLVCSVGGHEKTTQNADRWFRPLVPLQSLREFFNSTQVGPSLWTEHRDVAIDQSSRVVNGVKTLLLDTERIGPIAVVLEDMGLKLTASGFQGLLHCADQPCLGTSSLLTPAHRCNGLRACTAQLLNGSGAEASSTLRRADRLRQAPPCRWAQR